MSELRSCPTPAGTPGPAKPFAKAMTRCLPAAALLFVLLALGAPAGAASGLHQAKIDSVPEMLAAFGSLRQIGIAVLAVGLSGSLLSFASRRRGRRAAFWRVAMTTLWLFGAAMLVFGTLPETWRAAAAVSFARVVPLALLLAAVLAVFHALLAAQAGEAVWRRLRVRYGYALATTLWLAFLVAFVAVPVACAWSLVWSRGVQLAPAGWNGGAEGVAALLGVLAQFAAGVGAMLRSLFASRYWSLGCFTGSGGCGSAVNSILLGVGVSLAAGVLGGFLALFVYRARPTVRRWMNLAACMPMITPPFLVGFGLAQLFGKAGLVGVGLDALFGLAPTRWFFGAPGVVLAQVLVFFPLAYFMVLNALDSLSRAQIDAARFLGASDGDILRTVVLPALRDPLAVAMLVIFVETLSDIGNPLVVGGKLRVLPTELFYASGSELAGSEMAGVPTLLIIAIAFAMTALKGHLVARAWPAGTLASEDEPLAAEAGGRSEGEPRPRRRRPSQLLTPPSALRWGSGILSVATVLLLAAVYLVIGVGAFSEGGKVGGALTLDNFTRGFGLAFGSGGLQFTGSGWESLAASLLCAILVAPLGSAAGLLMVWILGRVGAPVARLVDGISSYLLSVPSVVIGAGFMLAFGGLGLSAGAAWGMILLAMLVRNLAVCLRFGGVGLSHVERAQLEMSGLFGAGSLATFRHVVAPMLQRVFLLCIAYGFVRSMTMLGSVLLLSSAENQVATTYMIDRIGIGEFGVGMAYGVVLAVCIGGTLGVATWLATRAWPQRLPGGWRAAFGDLKAAVVVAQKRRLRG